ncbi:hypothetical protein [Luedemannella helvata]|uniref:Class I SAM-dependent methyltransferase n=1 Tax=Luedemannella helvata TaxID=349315 RepID=A0ABN2KHF1_9ACTN
MKPLFIGGEMAGWSDLDGVRGPGPARGASLAALLRAAVPPGGRVLLAGPHDPALVGALPAARLTLLVRGVRDAEALSALPGVTVCCGGLDKLVAEPPFDTVVALDGVARLSSMECDEFAWGEAFEMLVAALRPGGRLLLGMPNALGVDRLVAPPTEPGDGDWAPAGEYDPTRPAGLTRARARLAAAGLGVDAVYAAYPSPTAPSALLGEAILADDAVTGFVAATLGRSFAPPGVQPARVGPGPGRPRPVGWAAVLTEPGGLARQALRQGLAGALAPGWMVVARRASRDRSAGLPGAIVDGRRLDHDPVRGWVGEDGAAVPPGRTLEDLLMVAASRRELGSVRALLARWQRGMAAGVPADQVVVTADGTFVALAPAREPGAALGKLAATLVRGGLADAWPAQAGAADLAVTLAAVAGAAADARAAGVLAVDGLVAERDRLARALAAARAKAAWYERTLADRESALAEARRVAELLSASWPAKAGMAFVGGVRLARRRARAVLRRVRPRV